jgi:uroporphyrinogen-III synthase
LAADGIALRPVIAYEARACPWPETVHATLQAAGRVVAPLFSPRAAAEFAARLGGEVPAGLRILAISAACADRLPDELRARSATCDRPDGASMQRALANALITHARKP